MKLTSRTCRRTTLQHRLKSTYARAVIWMAVAVMVFNGCATVPQGQKVDTTPIEQAKQQIPEEQLLDVGVMVFNSKEMDAKEAEKQGTTAETRKAETNFMAYHLKNTLEQSSHWGTVRVVPDDQASVDVLVKAEIMHSNGEDLVIAVEVSDATGAVWFDKRYRNKAETTDYYDTRKGEEDAFQDTYNVVANDMARYKARFKSADAKTIRNVSLLKFAETYAPDAYTGYLATDKKGRHTIARLPADDDPMLMRLQKIREREFMYLDTLNGLYGNYYDTMWPSYENWRKLNLVEREAIRGIRKQSAMRFLLGTLLVAGAIALGSNSDNVNTIGLQTGMVIIGGQVIMDGVNISQNADLHKEAIRELSDSFGSEMQPVIIDFEGKQYELTGTAQEQFKQWRELMRRIYQEETGFDTEGAAPIQPQSP